MQTNRLGMMQGRLVDRPCTIAKDDICRLDVYKKIVHICMTDARRKRACQPWDQKLVRGCGGGTRWVVASPFLACTTARCPLMPQRVTVGKQASYRVLPVPLSCRLAASTMPVGTPAYMAKLRDIASMPYPSTCSSEPGSASDTTCSVASMGTSSMRTVSCSAGFSLSASAAVGEKE